jgi:hypothetical protein
MGPDRQRPAVTSTNLQREVCDKCGSQMDLQGSCL